jgi:hypothetical protein
VAAKLEMINTSLTAFHPRHAARSPESPAHPAGAAPLVVSSGAPAAERRVVRRPAQRRDRV